MTRAARIPFWRDIRVLRISAQIAFVLLVVLLGNWLYSNLQTNLRATNISFSYDFLQQPASMGISEGLPFQPTDSYQYAFWVGVFNTLRVVFLGMVLATLLGLVIGVARLSSNWLVRTLSGIYIETLRNTPLVVQLVFWYTAVFLKLPRVDESLQFPGSIYLSQRGLVMPQPQPTESFALWGLTLLLGCVLAVGVYIARRIYLERVQRPGTPWLWGLSTFLFIATGSWFLLPQSPLTWEPPVMGIFNFEGGMQFTPEFTALLLGLVIYTAAFIAEIVRAGILAVSKGQKEAARALGLTNLQMMRLIVLPQALRVMIPPTTSQYLNLAKNSSLAVAIGYPDLFNVANTIINQSGRAIEVILMIMGSYLTISLLTSLFMNWYNRRVRLVER
ncbi:ABC transporter permease subunit [Candidatus Acetothermia bacterium]|jgi:general L-amino acid transport system permease protein|nr:ABC transporter permease subunit [Candidatus Acetothermia bacterium]MCI2432465.1 ABC transporter permease subunit [Candidatus Acetothermia bacterium]MCI2437103.1 ABC transporter permease subunit [Candidatus Acetothermia bacterium]